MFPAYFVTATERASKKFDGAFPHDQDEAAVVTPHAVPIALAIHDERACGIRASFIALGTVEHVNDLEAGMPVCWNARSGRVAEERDARARVLAAHEAEEVDAIA